jgi:hypothetical protein
MTALIRSSLTVPAAAGLVIAEEVRWFGRRDVETGGFLLAPQGQGTVVVVAFAGQAGITRHRLLFQVSPLALDRLFGFADQRACWVPAQFHSHATEAFLSPTDQQNGLRVSGFTSVVIPRFADPPPDVAAWGWWQFSGPDWTRCWPPGVEGHEVEVVIFDEEGVRAR